MARRPTPEEFDRPLTQEELAERGRRSSLISPHRLVTARRLIWKLRRKMPPERG